MLGRGNEEESKETTLNTMMAPVPLTSSSEDHVSTLQSHHTQLAHFNAVLHQSTPEVFQTSFPSQTPTSPRMATTTTTQTTQQTQTSAPSTGRGTGGQSTGTSGHTPTEVLNRLNIALCCAHPGGGGSGGGGGGGSSGGAGPPPGQPAPVGQGQAAIPAAADIKAMGNLPHEFIGDRTKADNFIEEVKAYFRVNEDVAGFNLPIKKVAFTPSPLSKEMKLQDG